MKQWKVRDPAANLGCTFGYCHSTVVDISYCTWLDGQRRRIVLESQPRTHKVNIGLLTKQLIGAIL